MIEDTIINRTMEPSDLKPAEAGEIIRELNDLIEVLKNKELKISSWYGSFELSGDGNSSEVLNRGFHYEPLDGAVDDKNFPWFLYWEIVWITLNAEFREGQRVLDLGGSSSLFSYYLSSKGLEVTTIDLQKPLVENANHVARQMEWKLDNHVMDMRSLDFDVQFDHITSICVYEHIPMYDRVEINKQINALLRPGGRFSITFDYRNPSRFARICTPDDVCEQFVKPSGLGLRGNQNFIDTGHSYLLHPFYHPGISWKYKIDSIVRGHFKPREMARSKHSNDYTLGALFQEK